MSKQTKYIIGAIVAVVILAGIWQMSSASGDIPVGGNGGSPTPVWDETVIPEETAQPTIYIEELPSTGAGTTAREVVQSEHTYTKSYYSCWKFLPGIWYLQQTTTRYADNWWGGGHYVVWSQTVNLGSRCYVA